MLAQIIAFLIPVGIFFAGAATVLLFTQAFGYELIHKSEVREWLKDLAWFRANEG